MYWCHPLEVNKTRSLEDSYVSIFESVIRYMNFSVKYKADWVELSLILVFVFQIIKLSSSFSRVNWSFKTQYYDTKLLSTDRSLIICIS